MTGGSLLAGLTPTGQCRSGLMLDGFTRNPVARKPEGGFDEGCVNLVLTFRHFTLSRLRAIREKETSRKSWKVSFIVMD